LGYEQDSAILHLQNGANASELLSNSQLDLQLKTLATPQKGLRDDKDFHKFMRQIDGESSVDAKSSDLNREVQGRMSGSKADSVVDSEETEERFNVD